MLIWKSKLAHASFTLILNSALQTLSLKCNLCDDQVISKTYLIKHMQDLHEDHKSS